jgi:hypothetical protein
MRIHNRALEAAGRFKKAEAELVEILGEIDRSRTYRELGYPSLFQYCVQALGLSENVSVAFIIVARKARQIPALQTALNEGVLSVSKAKKIAPVLSRDNQEEWIARAIHLNTRALEQEVVKVEPREATPERIRPVSENRLEVRLGISAELREKLERVQDLESQRRRKAASLEETLEALLEVYLEVKDPIRRAERILKKLPVTGTINHVVALRDGRRCTFHDARGVRCSNRRWIDVHHLRPRCEGGGDTADNLVTLCASHHRMAHAPQSSLK